MTQASMRFVIVISKKQTSQMYKIFYFFRCSACYHADTFQRAQHLLNIPDSQIDDIKFDEDQLYVTCK